MSDFLRFLENLCQHIGVEANLSICTTERTDEHELAAKILNEINRFLYQTNSALDREYISEFHKYWKENHFQILKPEIVDEKCLEVAHILEQIYCNNNIRVQHDTLNLTNHQIANVRFFTAIQDFKIDIGARVNPFQLYNINQGYFNPQEIVENELLVDEFLNQLGADSQRDKRKRWMQNAAQLLNDKYESDAFKINESHQGDVLSIKDALASSDLFIK